MRFSHFNLFFTDVENGVALNTRTGALLSLSAPLYAAITRADDESNVGVTLAATMECNLRCTLAVELLSGKQYLEARADRMRGFGADAVVSMPRRPLLDGDERYRGAAPPGARPSGVIEFCQFAWEGIRLQVLVDVYVSP